jgi:hypothetical protein
LLTGVERVAFVANVDRQGFAVGRTSFELVAAAAGYGHNWIVWMDIGFHGVFLRLACRHPTLLLNTARN